ncbi:MAG: hypothetical protein ACI9HJ_002142, partial [Ulvibacter sp.]
MRKNILILSGVLVTFSLLAYGVIDSKDSVTDQEIASNIVLNRVDKEIKENFNVKAYPDFAYDVGSRFMSRVTKEDLHKAKSILDILPKEQTDPVFRYKTVSVIIL